MQFKLMEFDNIFLLYMQIFIDIVNLMGYQTFTETKLKLASAILSKH